MSLVKITQEIRLLVKIGAGIAVIGILIFILIQGGAFIKNTFYPTPPPPPEEKFHKVPNLKFSSSVQDLHFIVNTVSGSLPSFPDRTSVYAIVQPTANILALQNVRNHVSNAGFTDSEARVEGKDTYYQWSNPTNGSQIIYDLLTDNFIMQSSYLTNPTLISDTSFPDTNTALDTIKDFLNTIHENSSDIDFSKSLVKLYTISSGNLTDAVDNLSKSRAKVAKVILMQNSVKINPFSFGGRTVDSLPITYKDPSSSNMTFTVVSTIHGFQVLEGKYFHFMVDLNNSSTYPIKTAEQAFKDLEQGHAFISYSGNLSNIDVTDINLAFYLSPENPKFLLPVYIFTGKDFTGYVQAIPDSSLE